MTDGNNPQGKKDKAPLSWDNVRKLRKHPLVWLFGIVVAAFGLGLSVGWGANTAVQQASGVAMEEERSRLQKALKELEQDNERLKQELEEKDETPSAAPVSVISSDLSLVVRNAFLLASVSSPELGKFLAYGKMSAYQAAHDNAMVIWSGAHSRFYKIPRDDGLVQIAHDLHWEVGRNNDDSALRDEFDTPVNRLPPQLGVAAHWRRDPDKWSWIGWLEYSCGFPERSLSYQKFQNGIVMGIFRLSPEVDDRGLIYIIKDDGTWEQQIVHAAPPECVIQVKDE